MKMVVVLMSRKVNEDRLCSGFYQAHDFLNFETKKYDKHLLPLVSKGIAGIKNFASIEDRNRYRFGNMSHHEAEYKANLLGLYSHKCGQEYDLWLNSLKFQFNTDVLHKIMPPNAILNNFFADLHVRVPHEKTLLIRRGDVNTVIVSVVEKDTNLALRDLRKEYARTNLFSTKKSDFENALNDFDEKDIHKHKEFSAVYDAIKSLETKTILICRLTVHTNINTTDIYKPERFQKDTIDAITGQRVIHYPMTAVFPTGVRIDQLDEGATKPPIMLHDIDKLSNYDYAWWQYYMNPYTSPPLEGHHLHWDLNDKESITKDVKRGLKNYSVNNPQQTVWHTIRQNLIHISVLTHPEFKEFCVNTLKVKGLEPNKTPYSIKNPYKKRPTWKPPFEHYMVTVNVPDEVSNEAASSTHKKRHHLVRGHLMRSSGKTAKDGFVWRRSHWRGNKKLGTVTKDYSMKIDERINKKAV